GPGVRYGRPVRPAAGRAPERALRAAAASSRMMISARNSVRLAGCLARSWGVAVHRAPRVAPPERLRLAVGLARQTLRALDLSVVARRPAPAPAGPMLIVANHISWVDVYALNALYAARFVAKSETARWPIVGGLTRGFDSIFIVRGSLRDAFRVKNEVAGALAGGSSVVVFPEATTTDGGQVLRFHPAMFQAALDAGVPVQPVALRYLDEGGRRTPAPACVGDMTCVESLRRVLRAGPLTVDVMLGPVLAARTTRRDLAAHAHAFVVDALESAPREAALGSRAELRKPGRRPPL